ncbi:MMPL family transporter [Streptomyces hydrogenans]|uniref:MMPL family transporter n=1 Tax=Streptomyces hydrogenans TaxID=1873719 RepID=UPI0034237F72
MDCLNPGGVRRGRPGGLRSCLPSRSRCHAASDEDSKRRSQRRWPRSAAPAQRASAPPVLARAATIGCAMRTLVLSGLSSRRALGPAVAIAMACCTAASLTFLQAVPVLCGRRVSRPREGAPGGWWGRPALAIEHRPRRVRTGCLVPLAAGATLAPLPTQTGVPYIRPYRPRLPPWPGTPSSYDPACRNRRPLIAPAPGHPFGRDRVRGRGTTGSAPRAADPGRAAVSAPAA